VIHDKLPANLTLRMRAADSVGPLILFKFQQEKQERPVHHLRRELLGPRGEPLCVRPVCCKGQPQEAAPTASRPSCPW
jgi:hypothetical protein